MFVKCEIKNKVAHIFLTRAEKKNALNDELVSEFYDLLIKLEKKNDISLLTITGEGDTFSAGADLAHIQKLSSYSFEENLRDSVRLKNLFHKIYSFPKPVLAIVNGHAIAGGAGLASVCDIILMKESAKIGYTEVKIGFIAAIVMVFLRQIVGEKVANDLLFSGRLITANEAKSLGLVNHVYSDMEFEESCKNYIEKLLNNSPQAQENTKKLLREIKSLSLEKALEIAVKSNAETRESFDCKEGIAAFLEKRNANWSSTS